jgi:hypothetical protein
MGSTIENNRPSRPQTGGQHRPSIGVRTLDAETPEQWRARIQQGYVDAGDEPPTDAELQKCERKQKPDPKPMRLDRLAFAMVDGELPAPTTADTGILERFEAERRRIADHPQPFAPF